MREIRSSIEKLINELPPRQQAEVRDFVEFLIAKKRSRGRSKPKFEWAGALKEMRDEYTSVELQHQISRWRSEIK